MPLWQLNADKVGFEPTEPFQVLQFSRLVQSTTLPLILVCGAGRIRTFGWYYYHRQFSIFLLLVYQHFAVTVGIEPTYPSLDILRLANGNLTARSCYLIFLFEDQELFLLFLRVFQYDNLDIVVEDFLLCLSLHLFFRSCGVLVN